jgi:hypothetical protein
MEIEMMMQPTDALTEQTLFCLNKLTCEGTSFVKDLTVFLMEEPSDHKCNGTGKLCQA